MREIFRTSLHPDHLQEELRLSLVAAGNSRWVHLEVYPGEEGSHANLPVRRVTLPLSLWPRFHEAVCCLGAFMKPLPAPAYQATACCSYLCPQTPGPVLLDRDPQTQIQLSLQDRRGSTFLEIKALQHPPAGPNSNDAQAIRIGPTRWSAFLAAVHKLDQAIAEL